MITIWLAVSSFHLISQGITADSWQTGQWGEWLAWSECSQTCGQHATRWRVRECLHKSNAILFKHCKGIIVQHAVCKIKPCPQPRHHGNSAVDSERNFQNHKERIELLNQKLVEKPARNPFEDEDVSFGDYTTLRPSDAFGNNTKTKSKVGRVFSKNQIANEISTQNLDDHVTSEAYESSEKNHNQHFTANQFYDETDTAIPPNVRGNKTSGVSLTSKLKTSGVPQTSKPTKTKPFSPTTTESSSLTPIETSTPTTTEPSSPNTIKASSSTTKAPSPSTKKAPSPSTTKASSPSTTKASSPSTTKASSPSTTKLFTPRTFDVTPDMERPRSRSLQSTTPKLTNGGYATPKTKFSDASMMNKNPGLISKENGFLDPGISLQESESSRPESKKFVKSMQMFAEFSKRNGVIRHSSKFREAERQNSSAELTQAAGRVGDTSGNLTGVVPAYNKAYIRPTGPRPTPGSSNATLEYDPELQEAVVFTIIAFATYVLLLVFYYWTLCYSKYTFGSEEDGGDKLAQQTEALNSIRHNMRGSEEVIGYKQELEHQKKARLKSMKDKGADGKKMSVKENNERMSIKENRDSLGNYTLTNLDEIAHMSDTILDRLSVGAVSSVRDSTRSRTESDVGLVDEVFEDVNHPQPISSAPSATEQPLLVSPLSKEGSLGGKPKDS